MARVEPIVQEVRLSLNTVEVDMILKSMQDGFAELAECARRLREKIHEAKEAADAA